MTIAAWVCLQCMLPSCRREASTSRWDTGRPVLDSLLSRADTLDRRIDYDAEEAMATYMLIAAQADTADASPRVRSVGRYAQGVLAEFGDSPNWLEQARRCDSLALREAETEPGAEYLQRRLELELAKKEPDLRQRTGSLYALLPYFTALSDSMPVTDILYELTDSFGEVWDPAMQTDCFREIIRWAPEFVAPLRDMMRYNILAVRRGTAPPDEYLHILDSVAGERDLLQASPPLAVIVYTDRYRLRGNAADLDSAAAHAATMTGYHDALKSYWAQQLRHALKTHDAPEADRYARLIGEHAADSSIMEIETLPVLSEYYRTRGDSAARTATDALYRHLRTAADAHEESTALAGIEADRKVSDITRRSRRSAMTWIYIASGAVAVLLGMAVWLTLSLRRRRRDSQRMAELNAALDNSRRRLVVAEAKSEGRAAKSEVEGDGGDWERFEAVFTEMHPGFADGLRRDFPALTRNDIRLCAFISMDMEIKHIARMLGIQPDSVKKQMRRLRTKLGVAPGAPLAPFLARY